MAALSELIDDTGLAASTWLLFPDPAFRRLVERYVDGTFIPNAVQLEIVGTICLEAVGADADEAEERLLELAYLADDARSARARDRRIARQNQQRS